MEPHINPPDHILWHAELSLNQCTVSRAEKHIQFTTLISLTQSISWPSRQAVWPFLEHFWRVFGCEWALGMRFEEDYQGPESCLGALCAFQQNCPCPSCISVGKMWFVSLSPPLCVSVSLSFVKWFRHWKTWLQGVAVICRSPFLSSPHLSSLHFTLSLTMKTSSVFLHQTLGK